METYYRVIPEDIVRKAAEYSENLGEYDNSFTRLLKVADEYRAADMTPYFLYDVDTMMMLVVCEETYRKKLN